MKKLSCIMIISSVTSVGTQLSSKASITGKVSETILFNTIEASGGQEFSVTFITNRPKRITNGIKYCAAFSLGAELSRNESSTFTGVVNKSTINFDNITTVNFEFKGNINSFATIYGLMK